MEQLAEEVQGEVHSTSFILAIGLVRQVHTDQVVQAVPAGLVDKVDPVDPAVVIREHNLLEYNFVGLHILLTKIAP